MVWLEHWLMVAAAIFGLVGSWYWYRSASVDFPSRLSSSMEEYEKKMEEGFKRIGRCNKVAAICTAFAMTLGAATCLVEIMYAI